MATEIILPKLGQTMEFATVVRWLVSEGDQVTKGQALLEIETDKAVLEVESFVEGTLLKMIAKAGETYDVLDVLGYIGKPGEAVPDAPKKEKKPAKASKSKPAETAPPKTHRPEAALRETSPVDEAPVVRISPRARKLAEEWLVNVAALVGTGPLGRIVVRDVQAYLDEHTIGPQSVSPAALALARNTDVTIDELLRIGGGERITVETVERALGSRPQPLSPIRRVIAERMTQSAREIPHFDVTMSVDMAAVTAYREAHPGSDGTKISFNDFIVAACASALREMPIVNARCIAAAGGVYGVQMNDEINIGVAASIDEGLVVPVIRNADARSIEKIAAESRRLVESARSKTLGPDEMAGGTFTITNMGMLGVEQFRAIIHPEQGAILAVGAVEQVPVVRDGEVRVGTQMKMTLSCDHRIIDGAVGAQFLGLVKQRLEAYGG